MSSSATAIATVTYASGLATIAGVAPGNATVTISDSEDRKRVTVTVVSALTVTPVSVSMPVNGTAAVTVANASGTVTASSSATSIATVSYVGGTATIRGVASGSATVTIADSRSSKQVAVSVLPALTVSPATATIAAGATATIAVTNIYGTATATSSAPAIATVSYAAGTATVTGIAAGTAAITIADSVNSRQVAVTVTANLTVVPAIVSLQVGNTATVSITNAVGTVTAISSATSIATVSYAAGIATIQARAAGSATITISDSRSSRQVAVSVVSAPTAASYSLLAWNDLGMHCIDGVDYSMFAILPPFNVLNAQLVNKSTGALVTSGVTLTYQAVADTRGSINTSSATKTNFWRYAFSLFGINAPPNVGLLGYPTPSLAPAGMSYNASYNWFEAVGIPITPYDDSGAVNSYPMVQVVAKSSAGQTLATTNVVLPVSDELTCKACHASTTSTNVAANAAKPTAGWIFDPNPVTDWKKNILRLHDQKQQGNATFLGALATAGYANGLYNSAIAGKPIFCAACHTSNAYAVEAGLQTGISGISAFTRAIHSTHGQVTDPTTGQKLDNIANRSACYMCHPGSVTQCLRGAMANVKDANGNILVSCQSCHGNMAAVGSATRSGWLSEPNCQACHHDSKRETSAVDAQGNLLTWTDTRFATTPSKPSAGVSLYRFSTGHGNLQCSACHGATHSEFPTAVPNDNVQSIAVQGYAGTVRECTACHSSVPTTANGGPHGTHTVGSRWVSGHEDAANGTTGRAACAYCHGADFRGSPLSAVRTAKTFNKKDSGTISYVAGQQVSCYDCHNGPSGGSLDTGTRFAAKDRPALDPLAYLSDFGGRFMTLIRGQSATIGMLSRQ